MLHGDAVGEGVGRRKRQLVLRLDRALHARRLRRLDAIDLAVRLQVLDGIGHARDEPAAADRHQHGLHVRQLLQNLQPQRPLPRDDVRVVEGMDKGHPLLPAQLLRVGARVVISPRHQADLRAVALRRLDLGDRRDVRHADHRPRLAALGAQRHPLRMVARAAGDDPAPQLLRRQLRDLVVRPTHLERARHLQILGLQPNLRVGRQLRRENHVRLPRDLPQNLGRVADILNRQLRLRHGGVPSFTSLTV